MESLRQRISYRSPWLLTSMGPVIKQGKDLMGSTTHAPALSYWPADTFEELLERSVGDALREAAAEARDHPAIIEGTPGPGPRRQLTYAELLTASEQAARALLTRFQSGQHVAVWAGSAHRPQHLIRHTSRSGHSTNSPEGET